jgi:hypothetical protein
MTLIQKIMTPPKVRVFLCACKVPKPTANPEICRCGGIIIKAPSQPPGRGREG